MIFKNRKEIIRYHYTIVELLVVLVIAGLLTGMTMSGIKGALARQGATGAVRTLANKISLAQSFAVSKNRYVALIVPDHEGINGDLDTTNGPAVVGTANGTDTWNSDGQYLFSFRKNRLCYVIKEGSPAEYKFDRWVDGYEWQILPSKTVAFITSKDKLDTSEPAQVKDIPDPNSSLASPPLVTSTALIFKPSGGLVKAQNIVIRIFRADYDPNKYTDHFIWQGQEGKDKGWKIGINGFTGRSRFCLGGESVED